ncbi:LLM class flavin-dependent oxidoreductase [Candidatus Poriferisodalis sp.]|uniref:LLM class flavin-dependent oxidoreductase n=1 Tax=Candidatus Poriferisodalis sp. TaxID=3101277 RepID=UPI003AF78DD8
MSRESTLTKTAVRKRNKFVESMRLGFFHPTGCLHTTSKRVADANPDWLDVEMHKQLASLVEEVGFDYIFMLDFPIPYGPESTRAKHMDPLLQPIMLAPYLFAATKRIGVVTTLYTTTYLPAAIARFGANLDVLSGGRWGWNVVTGIPPRGEYTGEVFGVDFPSHQDRYDAADELITIVKALWTSDEPIEFEGEFHRSKGKIVGPKPLQEPWPLIVQAGGSPRGREFAAKHTDYNFMIAMEPETGAELLADTRARAVQHGRQEDDVVSQFAILIFMRDTDEEAREFYRSVVDSLDWGAVAEYYDAAADPGGVKETADMYAGLTRREILEHWGIGQGLFRLVGSPETIAEGLLKMYQVGCLNGFALSFPIWSEHAIRDFAEKVLPILKAEGVWIPPWERDWCW